MGKLRRIINQVDKVDVSSWLGMAGAGGAQYADSQMNAEEQEPEGLNTALFATSAAFAKHQRDRALTREADAWDAASEAHYGMRMTPPAGASDPDDRIGELLGEKESNEKHALKQARKAAGSFRRLGLQGGIFSAVAFGGTAIDTYDAAQEGEYQKAIADGGGFLSSLAAGYSCGKAAAVATSSLNLAGPWGTAANVGATVLAGATCGFGADQTVKFATDQVADFFSPPDTPKVPPNTPSLDADKSR